MDVDHDNEQIMQALLLLDEATAKLRSIVGARVANGTTVVEIDEAFLDRRVKTIDFGNYTGRLHQLFDNAGSFEGPNCAWVPKRIETVRDLVSMTEEECLRVWNVGRKSVDRMKSVLAAHGLELGMLSDDR